MHIVVGAAIGATINSAYALSSGKSWSEVGAAALGGAVAGAISAATAGLGSGVAASIGLGVVGGAIGGAAGNLTEQSINIATNYQTEFDINELIRSGTISAATEGIGGGLTSAVSKGIGKAVTTSTSSLNRKEGYEFIQKEITKEFQQSGKTISNRKLNKLTRQRIEVLTDFDKKVGTATENIIQYGASPIVNNCVENEVK